MLVSAARQICLIAHGYGRPCAPTSPVQGRLGRAVDAIIRKESPASAGPPFQVVRRSTALGGNRFALLDSCFGRSRLRWRNRFTLLLRRIRGLMFLTRQFCGAQFPRPIAELVAHYGLLSVSTPACPSRLLRIVVPCYARTWSDVHTVSGVNQRVNSTPFASTSVRTTVTASCAPWPSACRMPIPRHSASTTQECARAISPRVAVFAQRATPATLSSRERASKVDRNAT